MTGCPSISLTLGSHTYGWVLDSLSLGDFQLEARVPGAAGWSFGNCSYSQCQTPFLGLRRVLRWEQYQTRSVRFRMVKLGQLRVRGSELQVQVKENFCRNGHHWNKFHLEGVSISPAEPVFVGVLACPHLNLLWSTVTEMSV